MFSKTTHKTLTHMTQPISKHLRALTLKYMFLNWRHLSAEFIKRYIFFHVYAGTLCDESVQPVRKRYIIKALSEILQIDPTSIQSLARHNYQVENIEAIISDQLIVCLDILDEKNEFAATIYKLNLIPDTVAPKNNRAYLLRLANKVNTAVYHFLDYQWDKLDARTRYFYITRLTKHIEHENICLILLHLTSAMTPRDRYQFVFMPLLKLVKKNHSSRQTYNLFRVLFSIPSSQIRRDHALQLLVLYKKNLSGYFSKYASLILASDYMNCLTHQQYHSTINGILHYAKNYNLEKHPKNFMNVIEVLWFIKVHNLTEDESNQLFKILFHMGQIIRKLFKSNRQRHLCTDFFIAYVMLLRRLNLSVFSAVQQSRLCSLLFSDEIITARTHPNLYLTICLYQSHLLFTKEFVTLFFELVTKFGFDNYYYADIEPLSEQLDIQVKDLLRTRLADKLAKNEFNSRSSKKNLMYTMLALNLWCDQLVDEVSIMVDNGFFSRSSERKMLLVELMSQSQEKENALSENADCKLKTIIKTEGLIIRTL